MRQTGLILEHRDTDYLSKDTFFGSAPVNPTGNWILYLPQGEKQLRDYNFDTIACSTFSATNTIETWINFLDLTGRLSEAQKQALSDFYIDGQFNISDRFTAIMSGTTPTGNSLQKVWDSIRKDGILPEKDLPFGGKNWNEYHDKSVITEEMKAKAKEYLKLFVFGYSWSKVEDLASELKTSPIQSVVYSGSHAVMSISDGKIFDTYDPFIKDISKIDYALKPFIYLADVKPMKKYKYFSDKEIIGLKPELVAMLDKARGIAGIPFVLTSGKRTPEQNKKAGGVDDSAHLTGYAVDIKVANDSSRYKMVLALLDVGFTRMGIYKGHIHVDNDPTKSPNVIWWK